MWDAEEEIEAEEGAHEEAAVEVLDDVPLPALESEEDLADGAGPDLALGDEAPDGKTARELRKELRERNKWKAEELARLSGLGHAKVNHRLNQEVGIRKVSEASDRELEARVRAADRWIERLRPAGPPR